MTQINVSPDNTSATDTATMTHGEAVRREQEERVALSNRLYEACCRTYVDPAYEIATEPGLFEARANVMLRKYERVLDSGAPVESWDAQLSYLHDLVEDAVRTGRLFNKRGKQRKAVVRTICWKALCHIPDC